MHLVCPGGRALLAFALLCALAALPACKLDPFTLGGDDVGDDDTPGGDGGDDGGGGAIDASIDALPDACVAFPEECNGEDDDCDNNIDEDFDTTQDPANCGSCGNQCFAPNTNGTCVDSECQFECAPGHVDTDDPPNVENGCEYACTVTAADDSICDLADNDCDTEIDEDVQFDTDINNCGSCGNRCVALNAEPLCEIDPDTNEPACTFGDCEPGFEDINEQITGCEYQCPVFPTSAEDCDGFDDDCDGLTDELPIEGLGDDCADEGFEQYMGIGRCEAGTRACSFGVEVCQGFVRPLADDSICNGVDDDCDGELNTLGQPFDEDVNFNDPRTCGGCTPCNLPFAVEGCPAGECTIVACLPGHVDEDGDASNGCEYACSQSGPEVCDGVDNDCDGDVDLDDDDLVPPGNFCQNLGACANTEPTCEADPCTGAVGWTCDYGTDAEMDVCGDLITQEARCDGLDGNCNGQTDEVFTTLGDECHDEGIGICRRTGVIECSDDTTTVECTLTSPPVDPGPEECDNEDDDCDTFVDEDAPDPMVAVQNGASTFYIYTYEASRPDAEDDSFGSASHRACSKVGVLPWRNVGKDEAEAACLAAGKRLCTEDEFELACGGPDGWRFPYDDLTYDPAACNGRDVDLDCTQPDSDQVAVTGRSFACPTPGATSACVSPAGAIDMSGNLREWTSTPVGASAFRVRGGGYDNIEQGLRCDFSFIAFEPDTVFPNLGFRCCADQPD
jgi:hypothetical protein